MFSLRLFKLNGVLVFSSRVLASAGALVVDDNRAHSTQNNQQSFPVYKRHSQAPAPHEVLCKGATSLHDYKVVVENYFMPPLEEPCGTIDHSRRRAQYCVTPQALKILDVNSWKCIVSIC